MFQKTIIKALLSLCRIAIPAFILLMLACMAGTAFAAPSAPEIEPPVNVTIENKDDLSSAIFKQILGDAWVSITGDNSALDAKGDAPQFAAAGQFSGLISTILQVSNAIGMAAVATMVIYMCGIFAVTTAHEGKKLGGSKLSSLWFPVRSGLAVGMNVPMLHGLSLLQVAVIAVVAMGINLANNTWEVASRYIVQQVESPKNAVPPVIENEARDMLQPVFQAVTVQELLKAKTSGKNDPGVYPNRQIKSMQTERGEVSVQGDYIIENREQEGRLVLWFMPGQGMTVGSLGGISVPAPKKESSTNPEKIAQYNALLKIAHARLQALVKASEELRKHARAHLADARWMIYPEDRAWEILPSAPEILAEYTKSVSTVASDQIATLAESHQIGQRLSKALGIDAQQPQGGWITAGIMPYLVSMAQSQFDGLTYGGGLQFVLMSEAQPDGTGKTGSQWDSFLSWIGASGPIFLVSEELSALKLAPRYATQTLLGGRSYTGHNESGDMPSKVSRVITQVFFGGQSTNNGVLSTTMSAFASQNPITAMMWFGDHLMQIGAVCLGISIGGGAIGLAPGLGFINEIVNNPAMGILMGLLLIGGGILCYVVPIYVVIVFLQGVWPWITSVVQTLVAAPLWSIAHALPEGEGFAGQHARKGYVQLLDVALRPFLLVVAVCTSFIVFQGAALLLNVIFSQFHNGMATYSDIGVIQDLISAIMFVAVAFIAYKTIACDHILKMPGQIVTWIGGIGMSMGNSEHAVAESTTVVGGVLSQGSRTAGGLGSHVGSHRSEGKGKGGDKGGKGNKGKGESPAQMSENKD